MFHHSHPFCRSDRHNAPVREITARIWRIAPVVSVLFHRFGFDLSLAGSPRYTARSSTGSNCARKSTRPRQMDGRPCVRWRPRRPGEHRIARRQSGSQPVRLCGPGVWTGAPGPACTPVQPECLEPFRCRFPTCWGFSYSLRSPLGACKMVREASSLSNIR